MSLNLSKNKISRIFKILIISMLCFILLALFILNINKTKKYESIVNFVADKYAVDKCLILAIIKAESNFKEKSVSQKNACGLMQITPTTFSYICKMYHLDYQEKDIFDPVANINAGGAYLSYLFQIFGTEKEVIAAFNAGEGNVRKWLLDKKYSADSITLSCVPFKETATYVKKVLFYKSYYTEKFNESSSSKGYKCEVILRRRINKRN